MVNYRSMLLKVPFMCILILVSSVEAQPPPGQDITISPPLGTATWNDLTGAWSVVLDGPVTPGTNQTITVTGVASLAGDRPQASEIRIENGGSGIHVFVNLLNFHSIATISQSLEQFSHGILRSCETQFWVGTLGDPDAVKIDKIEGMNIGTDLRGGLNAVQGIDNVSVTSNFYGNIETGGDLGSLIVGRKLALNSSLKFSTINVGGSINDLEAGVIYANITVGANGGSGDGRVSTIKATTGGGTNFGNFSGDFNGSLNAVDLRELGPIANRGFIQILGDLNADLTFEQDINDDNNGDPVIDVNGALTSQIVINASDGGYDWIGPARINMIDIDPNPPGSEDQAPYYNTTSSTLGGGAVGLVPFMYHAKESLPVHDTIITTGGFSGDVLVEHYGPVADADGNTVSTPPVTVYELALQVPFPDIAPDPETTEVCDSRWTDVTSSYTYAVSGRVLTISGTFANWKAYQIIPNDLVCNIDGLPVITYAQGWQGTIGCTGMTQTYGYGFQIKTGFDLNMNSVVESGDIDTWLVSPVDFDGDTDADAIDLFMLVDAVANGGGQ